MIVFKIKDNKIDWRSDKPDNYVLQPNEFGFSQEVISYTIVNNVMTDTTTQEDRDSRAELEQENEFLRETIEQLGRANDLAKEIFSFVRKHTGLTTNQRTTLKSLAMLLFTGDIEQAITDFSAIQRPTTANKMQKVYDKLKVKFDAL